VGPRAKAQQRTDHGASKIGAGGETDFGVAELKDWAL
jgi:hypothetical protein